MDSKEIRYKIAEYINENEFFWRKDLYNHLGITPNDYNLISTFFAKEIKARNIVIVDKNGAENQYMRVNKILKSELIDWKAGSRKKFGLDYSYLIGRYGDFQFDIRYDSDNKDITIEPKNCDLTLNISISGKIIKSYNNRLLYNLKVVSEEFLENHINNLL